MTERRFIEQFEDNVRLYPEKVILRDQDTCLTFRELDELSGRVYAYLKKKGIGREDSVVIYLTRGVEPIIALVGIWKAGAVAVLLDDFTPLERVEYIIKGCDCKLLIDSNNWCEILSTQGLGGHEETSLSDSSQIIYTSGSEGTPKGIIIEYGKLDLNLDVQDYFWGPCLLESDISLMLGPLSATLSQTFIYFALTRCMLSDIASPKLVMDVHACLEYIKEKKITVAGLPPSYLKIAHSAEWNLRFVIVGGEELKGVYSEDFIIHNVYGSTESSFGVCDFVVDKAYENTPIGKPAPNINVYLLGDDGKEVPKGCMGELCHDNPYTRCYINDIDDNNNVFSSGIYHTGDIARINEDGNYVILGRKTDMIKINGNRIEPAEIEAAVKRVLNLDWAFAKGFVEPERSFICVYYTADINIDYAHVREELMKILPTYMIPSYFVHIDSIPHLPNGKVDRQAFKAPEVADYIADYIPPTNELEERLCTSMQQVLGVERIGINDDFYLLGGDSLRTIRLVALCDIEGLNVSDIYTSRTPSRIAERWIKKQIMNN